MAGSNGSSARRGAPPPQHWPPETEEQLRAREYDRWVAQHESGHAQATSSHGHAGYPDPSRSQAYGYAQDPAHGGAYEPFQHSAGGPPPAPHYPPVEQPPRSGPHDGRPNPFAPQFERFSPGAPPAPPTDYGRAPPAFDQMVPPPGGLAGLAPPPPPHDLHHAHPEPQFDPRDYDLARYAPGQVADGQATQQGWPSSPPGQVHGWDEGRDHWPPPFPQHGHDPHALHPQHGYADSQYASDGRYAEPAGEEYPPEEEAKDRPRGPSTLVIVAALVGAIVAGGGLAYGYKLLGGGRDKTQVAEIKAPTTPAKTKPKEPGGKAIDHTEKTFLNRLSNDSLPPVPTSLSKGGGDAANGRDMDAPRRVQTTSIILNKDGSVSPQFGRSAEPPPPPPSGVPGLVIDGFGAASAPAPGASAPPARAPIPPPPPVVRTAPPPPAEAPAVRPPPPPPRVADLPLPKVQSQAPSPPPRAPVPKRPQERDDLPALRSGSGAASVAPAERKAVAAAAPAAASGGANGYVAVLASKKNRQEALSSFADIYQKYPDVLGGRTPDVREVNLADKGVWYRLIVGPPGSRQAARDLCVKLKERGMKDCWPTAY